MTIQAILSQPDIDYLEEWMGEDYFNNKEAFDYVIERLREAFKKQHFDSWFDITTNDFEEIGEEMTDEEIDQANEELEKFFRGACLTPTGGYFLIQKGKIPLFITKIIEGAGWWNKALSHCDTWAVIYWGDSGQQLSFYGCPKGLDPLVNKLLYD